MIYIFEDYELDIKAHELRQAAVIIPLAPKVYHVLVYLIERHERVVRKDELLERVWAGTHVDDSAVKRCITAARRALADQSGTPRCIKTVRGQGYRFIAPVTVSDRTSGDVVPVLPDRSSLQVAESASAPRAVARSPQHPVPLKGETAGQRCPGCQTHYEAGARFCGACGTPLTATCHHCGQTMHQPVTFCLACGKRLESATLPPDRTTASDTGQVTTEHKLVTVLCGVMSYESMSSVDRELDAVHRAMQAAYDLVLTEVQRYEGTLQYVTGEGFLAVFGAPIALEDHARRAALAASGLQHQWGPQRARWQLPEGVRFTLRIALHTGLVVFSPLPQGAGAPPLVLGEVPAMAAAIARAAAPESILASEATRRLLPTEIPSAARPALHLTESATPIPVVQLLGTVWPDSLAALPPETPQSPFVGRDSEMAILQTRLGIVERGQGQVVGIVGEPGMGKSRLLTEFRQVVMARGRGYVTGHCQSYGSAIPYLPFTDLLRALWQIAETDTVAAMTHKVVQELCTLALDPQSWAPYLLALLGVESALEAGAPVRPETLRARTFEALHRCILQKGWQRPYVLAIENAHWIDASSAACLTALVERLAGVPLLLVVTFRPGYQPSWLDKSYATQVALQPLGRHNSRTIVRTLLRATPLSGTLEQQLLQKAQGNPFFLEELAQSVREQPGPTPTLRIPGTIQAVLAARMDRLPRDTKRLLQTAAVIGMDVPGPLLGTIAAMPEEVLQEHLTHLQTGEFLYATRFAPEVTYTFKHVLTHDVAYNSLLHDQRQALHIRIVAALENGMVDPLPEHLDRLAQHALQGALWDKACQYFWRAGTHAMGRGASQEAAVHFERALHALQHVPTSRAVDEQRIDLALSLHHAFLRLGDLSRCFEILQQATTVAEVLDDGRRLGWIYSYLSTGYLLMGEAEKAITSGRRALTLGQDCEDTRLQGDAELHLGQAYHAVSAYRPAIEVLKQNVAPLEAVLSRESLAPAELPDDLHAFAWLVWCFAETGAFPEGLRYGALGMRGAEVLDQPYALVAMYGTVGLLYLRKGDLPRAIPLLERSLALCQSADLPLMLPTVAANTGIAYALSGRLTEALPLLERTVAGAHAQGLMVHHALQLVALSEAYLLAQRLEEAATTAQCALTLARTRQEPGYEAYALQLLGAVASQGDTTATAQARRYYQQAIVLARAAGMQPLLAHCYLGLGHVCLHLGHTRQARESLGMAQDLYHALAMTFWYPQVEAARARLD